MDKRKLGGLSVGAIGLGCMGMSEFYGVRDDETSLRVLEKALEIGVTMLDTSDLYGDGHNEELLGRFFKASKGAREKVVLATKFGIRRLPGVYSRKIDNSPEYIRSACEASLKRLGVDAIDLYYVHRIEQGRPIEETVGVLAELVKEGKIRAIGLSEPSAATLEKACAAQTIAAVQSEYSLWTRGAEKDGVLKTCKARGVGFVAYSPLGRGFLTGTITDTSKLAPSDFRKMLPRFEKEKLGENARRLKYVYDLARVHGATPAQIALSWVLSRPFGIVPIPGTKKLKYLEENVASAKVVLTAAEIAGLEEAFPVGADYGERYTPEGMKSIGV
ncbi:MAG TPA: aldo/keto reductase [Opitutales bacterium]|nr:aldo/keto reductase [Opitutales bacterium]